MGSPRRLNRPGHLHAFFVVGEASGDVYGAGLIRALGTESEALGLSFSCTGWGGDAMAEAGMDVLTHCNNINHMGFWEVFKHLPSILGNFKRAQRDIQTAKPDVVVTIDFPGFNMRLAKRLRKAKHPAFRLQWVAPQVWAWKAGRVHALAQDFDAVAPILPFEREALESAKVEVWNEGHPLLDVVQPTSSEQASAYDLVLLPGSRAQELDHHLKVMVDAAQQGAAQGLWSLQNVVVAGAPGQSMSNYKLAAVAGIQVRFGQTQTLLQDAQLAWVASGTATLEAALLDTPHVVVYKTSRFTYALAKRLAQVTHIGLPNLLAGKEIVPELIQDRFTATQLLEASQDELLPQKHAFQALRDGLGGPGATRRLAKRLLAQFETT
ncbi:MAG: lipid-A-disaccharide synthase [Flavobacteriales bacterium]